MCWEDVHLPKKNPGAPPAPLVPNGVWSPPCAPPGGILLFWSWKLCRARRAASGCSGSSLRAAAPRGPSWTAGEQQADQDRYDPRSRRAQLDEREAPSVATGWGGEHRRPRKREKTKKKTIERARILQERQRAKGVVTLFNNSASLALSKVLRRFRETIRRPKLASIAGLFESPLLVNPAALPIITSTSAPQVSSRPQGIWSMPAIPPPLPPSTIASQRFRRRAGIAQSRCSFRRRYRLGRIFLRLPGLVRGSGIGIRPPKGLPADSKLRTGPRTPAGSCSSSGQRARRAFPDGAGQSSIRRPRRGPPTTSHKRKMRVGLGRIWNSRKYLIEAQEIGPRGENEKVLHALVFRAPPGRTGNP